MAQLPRFTDEQQCDDNSTGVIFFADARDAHFLPSSMKYTSPLGILQFNFAMALESLPPADEQESLGISCLPYGLGSLVGFLMYAAGCTQPGIPFITSKLYSFLDCYDECHWKVATRVVCRIRSTRTITVSPVSFNLLHSLSRDVRFARNIFREKHFLISHPTGSEGESDGRVER
jgi:hypothetical protein